MYPSGLLGETLMFYLVHVSFQYEHVDYTPMTCYVAYVGGPFIYLHNPTEFLPQDRSILVALFKFPRDSVRFLHH